MFSRVVELAGKTRAIAENAFEALDAPDVGGPPRTPPQLAEELLSQLVEAVSYQSCDGIDVCNAAKLLMTQIKMLRETAASSSLDVGSLVEALGRVVETGGASSNETSRSLIDALEKEQKECAKLRLRVSELLSNGEVGPLAKQIEELELDKEEALLEVEKLKRQISKLVKEKIDLQLERDNADLVDARVLRSAFIGLSSQINNLAVRDGVLRVMAEMLNLSPDERIAAGINASDEVPPKGLATQFLQFLQEEVDASPSQLDNSFSEI